MSILVNKHTRLLGQGITGREGLFHAERMVEYGTKLVAGVTPGKGGEWIIDSKVPIFNSVSVAVQATEANVSIIFVPARFSADAIYEAADFRDQIDRVHHRRNPGKRHDAGAKIPGSTRCAYGRT